MGLNPMVTGVDLLTGPDTGGAVMTLTGTNFSPEATVTFGDTPAPSGHAEWKRHAWRHHPCTC